MNTKFPNKFFKGDSISFTDKFKEYKNYDLKIVLTSNESKYVFEFINNNSVDFDVLITHSETNEIKSGYYNLNYIFISKDNSIRKTYSLKQIVVEDNMLEVDKKESKTFAEIALENVESVIANKATLQQKSYSIADRRLDSYSLNELLAFRRDLINIINNEKRGGRGPKRILVNQYSY